MKTDIVLVQQGMAMQSGTVVQWMKSVGDSVEKGDVLAEIEESKSVFEIESPCAGVLAEILVPADQEVPVRTVLARVTDGADEIPQDAGPVPAEDGSAPSDPSPAAEAAQGQESASEPSGKPAAARASGAVRRARATPVVRKLAGELGLDIDSIDGTGPQGRVTRADVERARSAAGAAREPASPAAGNGSQGAGPGESPTTGRVPAGERISLAGIRGRIAQRMHASLQDMAQFTVTSDADVTDLVGVRELLRAGLDFTFNHLVIKAAVLALREHPRLNAHLVGGEIHVGSELNIGLAIPADEGLMVGVLRGADAMSLGEIAARSDELIRSVKAGNATREQLTGSTFTVSNLGPYGIDVFTPIVNPPEVAILGVGRIRKQPAPSPDGQVAWRDVVPLSLTVDHRAVDGTPAAQFLAAVAGKLAAPGRLLDLR